MHLIITSNEQTITLIAVLRQHLSSNESFFREAYDKIVSMFLDNGFISTYVIERIKNQIVNRTAQEKKDVAEVKFLIWRLPFIKEKESQRRYVRLILFYLATTNFVSFLILAKVAEVFPTKIKCRPVLFLT